MLNNSKKVLKCFILNDDFSLVDFFLTIVEDSDYSHCVLLRHYIWL